MTSPVTGLGQKYVDFWGMTSPAATTATIQRDGSGLERKGRISGTCSSGSGGVGA